ncbi:MAG: N-acetylmuramoyl-L-alanine amidase, partial [Candidatus Eremiobacteraeota bacterium]|nr:N-acetylmuramoyl-L-alanine amidase [Candidatus Eremiobacteraeota bacterium]
HFKRLTSDGDALLTLAFSGISSTLERNRQIAGAGLQNLAITAGGTPRNPRTVVDFETVANGTHALVPSDSPNAISIAFAPPGVVLGGTPIPDSGDATVATTPLVTRDSRGAASLPGGASGAAPAASAVTALPPAPVPVAVPQTAPTPTALGLQPATVTGLRLDPQGDALNVMLGIAGPVTYEWHRLSDDRWYVDLKPATLAMDAQDVPVQSPAVQALRVKGFVGPTDRLPTVRVALTLASPRIVTLIATSDGLQIAVDRLDDLEPQKVGLGELAGGKLVASVVPLPPVVASSPDATGDALPSVPWKFAPPPAGTNPRLIVIDPGHGGSDFGAMHNGLVEKNLTLDISKRLRALLIARGWLVKMTRDSDVDVYQPNDSARDELQARDDIANRTGARLFISVHINAFTSGELNGTTTYYYKTDSYGLADAVHARLAATLPTKDDGIRKENFYVIRHANAPSILIETAFCSNPSDAQLLHSDAFLQKVASGIANGVGDYASPARPIGSNGGGAPDSDGN